MKGCPVAFFSFAFCVKQIAFKLTPQFMQLTCTLSMSDRDPWSLEEHQAPALNNRVSATDSGPCPDLGQTDCPAGTGCTRMACRWTAGTDGRTARQQGSGQLVSQHTQAGCSASRFCCRERGERPKHKHL